MHHIPVVKVSWTGGPPWLSSLRSGSCPRGAGGEVRGVRDVPVGPVAHIHPVHEDLAYNPCLVGLKKDSLFGQAIEL